MGIGASLASPDVKVPAVSIISNYSETLKSLNRNPICRGGNPEFVYLYGKLLFLICLSYILIWNSGTDW